MGKIHAKIKKFADGWAKSSFRVLACRPYRSVERLKKKRVTLEQLEQLALERPWNTEEEKKDLLSLIVEYNDVVDKAVLKFLECKNCWVE